jgi:hypothetical protein
MPFVDAFRRSSCDFDQRSTQSHKRASHHVSDVQIANLRLKRIEKPVTMMNK